jgi:hypothetical protein
MTALARIEEKLDRLLAGAKPVASTASVPDDPIVRMDPKKWAGASMKGKPMSACPRDGLIMYAGLLDWFADKNANEGKAGEAAKDRAMADKARTWAEKASDESGDDAGELPF